MPGPNTSALLGIFVIAMAVVVIVFCRWLAQSIREVNRYDENLPVRKRRR